MKVLEVMGSLKRGGAETMIMNYYRAFDKCVCQMDFVVHTRNDGDFCNEAEQLGAKIVEIPTAGSVGIIRYIKILKKVIEENGPYDAVHAHYDYQDFLAVIAAKLAGVKTVIVHSHTTSFSKKRLAVNRAVFNLFKPVKVACGEKAGDAFFGKGNYIILSNAMDVSKFMNANVETSQNSKFVIGHLGRFVTPKNHEFIVEVAKKLKERNADVCFRLYGEGEHKDKILQLVNQNGLEDTVYFMGLTNDTASAYKSFDVFILPSLFEGVPLTLIEAQLSGIVCLASDKITKECDLNQGTLSFLPLDADVWADRIVSLLDNDLHETKVVINDMVEKYDVNIQCKKLISIYKGDLK